MKRRTAIVIAPLMVLLGACGSTSRTATPPLQSTTGGGASGVSLSTASVSGLGTVVVNAQGRTLYTFAPDQGKKVTCTGSCAQVWQPLKVPAGQEPTVSAGAKASLVSSVSDPAGGRVITYAGWPLYLYKADQAAGTAHGQALNSSGGLWYAISPAGTVIKKKVKTNSGY